MYGLNLTTGKRITSAQIQHAIGRLDIQGSLQGKQMEHLTAIEHIEARGIRYSNQDFDVLSSALNFLDAVNPDHSLRT